MVIENRQRYTVITEAQITIPSRGVANCSAAMQPPTEYIIIASCSYHWEANPKPTDRKGL